jgi:hypothetical protein
MHKRYDNQTAAFLTQHGKESLLAPVLEPFLGCKIQRVEGFDTDQLGSFSGEVQRLENQVDTARRKARIGMDLANLPIGIASEGSFIADPLSGMIPWNIEVVVWLDTRSQFEVVGIAQGPTLSLHKAIQSLAELETFANQAQFPAHHLTLRPQSESDNRLHKGIASWDQLRHTFIDCQNQSTNGRVYVEHDYRAFCHPTRQAMIQRAVHDLMQKFESICPRCAAPGFAVTAHRPGLACRTCGNPTKLPNAYTQTCSACNHAEEKAAQEQSADPSRCDVCNP